MMHKIRKVILRVIMVAVVFWILTILWAILDGEGFHAFISG